MAIPKKESETAASAAKYFMTKEYRLRNPFTGQLFWPGKPERVHEIDSWTESQIEANILIEAD